MVLYLFWACFDGVAKACTASQPTHLFAQARAVQVLRPLRSEYRLISKYSSDRHVFHVQPEEVEKEAIIGNWVLSHMKELVFSFSFTCGLVEVVIFTSIRCIYIRTVR